MKRHHPGRLDRDTAEQLLNGVAVDSPEVPDSLIRLLGAARATAHAGELGGEPAALHAFRTQRLDLVVQPRRPSMLETALAKLLTLKVAAATVVAAAATGGVALAAANGALPNPLNSGEQGRPSAQATQRPSADRTGEPSAAAGGRGAPGPHGSPSPSMVGLCRAYQAGAGDNPGKALENPAFGALIATAGGKDRVAAYCDALLAAESANESGGAAATRRPDRAPSTHPTGRPDSVPTSRPTQPPAPTVPAAPGRS